MYMNKLVKWRACVTARYVLGGLIASAVVMMGGEQAWSWTYEEAAKPYKGTTIQILDEVTPLQQTVVKFTEEFEKETGIKVEVELLNHYDVIRKGEADLLSGRGFYDAVLAHPNQLGKLLDARVIKPIDQFIADPSLTNPKLDLDDFIQPAWHAGAEFGGKIYSFPHWNYISVYAGRSDLLNHPDEKSAFNSKYGYELAPPETMQQMRDIAEFFTRSAGEKLAGKELESDFYGIVLEGLRYEMFYEGLLMNFIRNWGGSAFDENGAPTFDSPETIEAVKFWADLWKFSPPGTAEYGVIDIPTVMGNGIAAQALLYADFMLGIDRPGASPHAGNFVYRGIPRNQNYDQARSAYGLPSSIFLSEHSENPEATYLYMQWIVEKHNQNKFIEENGTWVPVRTSSFEHPLLKSSKHAEAGLYDAMRESLSYNHGSPISPDWFEILDRAGGIAQQIGLGEISVEEGMNAIQDEVSAICNQCVLLP